MSKFKHWNEFVKNKDSENPPVKKIADYPGPFKNKPDSGGANYISDGKTKKKFEKGLGDEGDKKLVYEPKIDQDFKDSQKDKYDRPSRAGKVLYPTVKEFVEKTSGMSASRFAQYVTRQGNTGPLHESIHNTASFLKKNPSKAEDFVMEAHRSGFLKEMIRAALMYKETYEEIAKIMGDESTGLVACRKLVDAMNEMVGPPAHFDPDHSDEDEDAFHQASDKADNFDDMDYGDEDDDEDEDHDGDDEDHDDDDDDFGLNDEDTDDDDPAHDGMGDGSDDELGDTGDSGMDEPGGLNMGRGANFPPRKHDMDQGKPSFMTRMMRREHRSPAFRNFQRALNS